LLRLRSDLPLPHARFAVGYGSPFTGYRGSPLVTRLRILQFGYVWLVYVTLRWLRYVTFTFYTFGSRSTVGYVRWLRCTHAHTRLFRLRSLFVTGYLLHVGYTPRLVTTFYVCPTRTLVGYVYYTVGYGYRTHVTTRTRLVYHAHTVVYTPRLRLVGLRLIATVYTRLVTFYTVYVFTHVYTFDSFTFTFTFCVTVYRYVTFCVPVDSHVDYTTVDLRLRSTFHRSRLRFTLRLR